MTTHFNRREARDTRRTLRNNATAAEDLLWHFLRRSQLGVRFHRQYSIHRYVLDFYAPRARLCVELDGDTHFTPEGLAHDARRTERLEALGIEILRFTNIEVLENRAAVLDAIFAAVRRRARTSP